jgi:5-methylthioadenosine/S-adenosylhomocysteine deaminase
VETIRERYGVRPVRHLEQLGLLDPRLIAAHVVWADEAEIDLLAQRGVGVIHNPTSNLKLASGVAPIPAMLRAGVKVGLGTDGAASNNDLDMWREMHLAALIHKGVSLDPTVVPARTAVHMATLGGAQALGLGDEIGALTVGRRADLIQVRLTEPHLIPRYDIFSHLVYAARADDVDTVVVDGQIVMHGRRVLTLDEAAIRAGVARISDRVRGLRLGVEGGTPVPAADRNPALTACPSCGAPLLVAR